MWAKRQNKALPSCHGRGMPCRGMPCQRNRLYDMAWRLLNNLLPGYLFCFRIYSSIFSKPCKSVNQFLLQWQPQDWLWWWCGNRPPDHQVTLDGNVDQISFLQGVMFTWGGLGGLKELGKELGRELERVLGVEVETEVGMGTEMGST